VRGSSDGGGRLAALAAPQRQSTFMRHVTAQLVQKLEGIGALAPAAADVTAECHSTHQDCEPAAAVQDSGRASDGGATSGSSEGAVLSFAQFLQAMQQLSRTCFPRIANAARAWQLLVERHMQPLADKRVTKCAVPRSTMWAVDACASLCAER
jgi:hypothetical protein